MKLTTTSGEEHHGDTLLPADDGSAVQLLSAGPTVTVEIDDLRSVIDP